MALAAVLLVGCGKPSSPTTPATAEKPTPPAAQVSTGPTTPPATDDSAAVQGRWKVSKMEASPKLGLPPEFGESLADSVSVLINDNRLTITSRLDGGDLPSKKYALIKLDSARTPRGVELTDATATFEPLRTLPTTKSATVKDYPPVVVSGIYKFEGETLLVAFPTWNKGDRPTEFKPTDPKKPDGNTAERSAVVVLHLTKTK